MKALLLLLKPIALAGAAALAMLPWGSNTAPPLPTSAIGATTTAPTLGRSQHLMPPDPYKQEGCARISWTVDMPRQLRRMHLAGDDITIMHYADRPWIHHPLHIMFPDPCEPEKEVPETELPSLSAADPLAARTNVVLAYVHASLSLPSAPEPDTAAQRYGIRCKAFSSTAEGNDEPLWHAWVREQHRKHIGDVGIVLPAMAMDTVAAATLIDLQQAMENWLREHEQTPSPNPEL